MNIGNFLKLVGHTEVYEASRTLSILDALARMEQLHSRSLVITSDEDHLPVGYLSMNNIAELVKQFDGASKFRVAQAMSVLDEDNLVSPSTSLVNCANLILEKGKTHLFIGEKDQPLQGVFSPTDWLRFLAIAR